MRKWVGIGLILIAIGVAGLLSPWSDWRSDWVERVEVNEQHRVPAEGIKRLAIEMDSENVRIVEGTQSDFVIRVEGKVSTNNRDRNMLDFNVSDGTLHARKPDWGFMVGFNYYSIKVIIEVPSAAYESIDVETDSGDIEVRGLVFDNVKADTDSGDIAMQQVKSKSIDIDTDSGDAVVEDTEGKVASDSDSGDFFWKGPQLAWPIEVKSDSGDAAFEVGQKPENAAVKFTSDSGDGVIEWDGVIADGGDSIQEVYGGGSPVIQVSTDSGDFMMKNR